MRELNIFTINSVDKTPRKKKTLHAECSEFTKKQTRIRKKKKNDEKRAAVSVN